MMDLFRCVYFERATAHVLLGALPRIADLETKLALGRRQYDAMLRASRLEKALVERARIAGGIELAVPRAWRDFIADVDAATPRTLVRRLCIDVATDVLRAYRTARRTLDAMLDAPLVDVVDAAIRELTRELRWARRLLGVRPDAARHTPAGADTGAARAIRRDKWLAKPGARVHHPARPAKQPRLPGAAAIPFVGPGLRSAGAMLHENIDAEITTMELFARCSYEHPEMPEAFHRDMSRQVSDESRHAVAFADGAAKLGAPHGTWPTSTDVYDFHYEYAPVAPGSQRELLWRLLLRSTLQEALSLDSFAALSARLLHDGAPAAARLLEAITADEVFHVESGLKWSRYLCGGDDDLVYAERDAAHRYFAGEALAARREFVRRHPDVALRETREATRVRQEARDHYPFDLRMYLAEHARRDVGFTERDLDQVVAWGYAHR
jgi:uncharacterized ferritin-like protein (DUF455 family)